MYHTHSKPTVQCQICGNADLKSIIFLGFVSPVNTMNPIKAVPVEEPTFPLELIRCDACGLVQIGCEVEKEVLFPETYPYLSGSTRILKENFSRQADEVLSYIKIQPNDLVVDIGSNDGTLLDQYKQRGLRTLGVEPSQAADLANQRGIETVKNYFTTDVTSEILRNHGKSKIVTACNVFAHITNVHSIVENILSLMDEDGLFVSESHYLLDLVTNLQYDTIYHEHLRYYHLRPLVNMLKSHGLVVFHATRIPTHGGSIRVFASRNPTVIYNTVDEMLMLEDSHGLNTDDGFKDFRKRVINSKQELNSLLKKIKDEGSKIYGVGAPSRASTLLNYAGIDDGILEAVLEISSSHKLNKYMPGTRIPVLDEKILFEENAEYVLVLSWHIAEEIVSILKGRGYLGKFIIPLPSPHILE
jgi:hypothetical protein